MGTTLCHPRRNPVKRSSHPGALTTLINQLINQREPLAKINRTQTHVEVAASMMLVVVRSDYGQKADVAF
jgi:hypothetical protein